MTYDVAMIDMDNLIQLAGVLEVTTMASIGSCLVFLKLAFDRFQKISETDLIVAAQEYRHYIKDRKTTDNLNLPQAQLYSLMRGYLEG